MPTRVNALRPTVFLVIFIMAGALIAACGGGGGGGGTGGTGSTGVSFVPTPTPTPTPVPTTKPVNCSLVRPARVRPTLVAARAIVPQRVGPGPAVRVCPDQGLGWMHCESWLRTDVISPKVPSGYGPSDLQQAYNLSAAAASQGFTQTVAIVDAFDDPNAESDLAMYRSTFGLPPCTTANGCFLKVNQSGATSPLPASDSGWGLEISLDLDMVSAVCPNCGIVLVEATDNSGNLYIAENAAANLCGATEISNSWDGGEYAGETGNDATYFKHPGIPITFASGDNGYDYSGDGYPVSSPYVTAVGGTTLTLTAGVWSEAVWGGSGSLCSTQEAQPVWQQNLGAAYTSICNMRIDNDVAAVADPNKGVAIYDTFGHGGWLVVGGTSAATPVVASVYALAGNGSTILDGSYPYHHAGSLNDVTSGNNGSCSSTFLCTAGTGYDGPSGNGTPNGTGGF